MIMSENEVPVAANRSLAGNSFLKLLMQLCLTGLLQKNFIDIFVLV